MNLAAGTGSLGAHLRDKEQPQAHCQDSEGKFLSSGEPGRGEVEGAGGKLLILQGKFIQNLQGSENTGWYRVGQVRYPHVHSGEERLCHCKWKPDP